MSNYNKAKKMKKIFAIAIICIFVILMLLQFLAPLMVGAASLNDKVKEQQELQDKLKDQLKELETKEANALNNKKKIDNDLATAETEVNAATAKIKTINEQIAENQIKYEAAKELVDKHTNLYKKRMRAIYEEGNSTYFEILFESDSVNDFFYRYEMMQEILQYDRQILVQMEEAKKTIETAKKEIEDKKAEEEAEKANLLKQQNIVKQKQTDQQKAIDKIKSEEILLEKDIAAAEAAEKALRQQIAAQGSNSSTSQYTGGKFLWPTPSCTWIISPFSSARPNPVSGIIKAHTGIDIPASMGANVLAAEAGTVTYAGWNGGYGYCVVIDHGGGYSTLYGHSSQLLVSSGAKVTRGQVIMKIGSTGNSTGPHLHFEVLINGVPKNPVSYLQ